MECQAECVFVVSPIIAQKRTDLPLKTIGTTLATEAAKNKRKL